MSIFPPTDLIIDVDNAADPSKRSMAIQRLKHISSTLSDHPVNIVSDTHMTHFENSYRPASLSSIQERATPHQINQDPVNEASSLKKFEAFLLQSWLELLLPKIEGGAYGHDGAAGTWRSLFAEQLGAQLAQKDCIGINRLMDHDNSVTTQNFKPIDDNFTRKINIS